MTRILVLSDTHIPKTAHDLPDVIYSEIKNVDMIIHAGDFMDKAIYDKLKSLKKIVAVQGNMDAREVQSVLNQKEVVEVEGVRIGLIHGYGAPSTIIDTVKSEFKNVNAIVFGHLHSAVNTKKNGILYFNPGSPTDKIFATKNSYGILEINGKKIEGRIMDITEQHG